MRMNVPDHVNFIIDRLYDSGFEAYAVGGCVRDTQRDGSSVLFRDYLRYQEEETDIHSKQIMKRKAE